MNYPKINIGACIHCTTKELVSEMLSVLDSMGCNFFNEDIVEYCNGWDIFKSNTYYRVCENKRIVYGNIFSLEPSDILTAEDFINLYKNNNMQKSDIKSGMSVKLRNGQMGLIVDVFGKRIIQLENNWFNLDKEYNQDLINYNEWDIMEVYRVFYYDCVIRKNLCKPENLIWKREKVTELTMQEIADKFGISINSLE